MYKISDIPSRREVLEFLSQSASFGNLGLFIGAGFSKAVINDGSALSWGELVESCAEEMGIDYENEVGKEGVGYPQIATNLCELHSSKTGGSYQESLKILKQKICELTSLYPTREARAIYSEYIRSFNPSWIITTNYDLVIESLLTGKAVTLSPTDQLIAASGLIPVFHLHGVRSNPNDLVISQEDYVSLFRPNEYRQIKLALTIKESTVLLFGYGLGDVNVLTALDWSKNVFEGQESNYPQDIVQIVRSHKPNENPYRDKNGIVILETVALLNFFAEFKEVRGELLKKEEEELANLEALSEALNDSEDSQIEKFIDDEAFRIELLQKLSEFPTHLISSFETFLDKCIEETWKRSEPYGAFRGYAQNLTIILDILQSFPLNKMPPALFEILANALNSVGRYVGYNLGESRAAARIWDERKETLSGELTEELRQFASKRNGYNLKRLLDTEE
jgi:hypothetical protein